MKMTHGRQCALKPYENCAVVKAHQKNTRKESSRKWATEPNRQWYYDIGTIKSPKSSGTKANKPVWHITVKEATGMKMSGFYPGKGKTIEPMYGWLQKQKEQGKPVRISRQDNASKNKKFRKRYSSPDWKMDVSFEYMAKKTLKFHLLAGTAFTTIAARSRAATNTSNVPMMEWYRLFTEAANTLTKLDWLQSLTINDMTKTRIAHFGMEMPKFTKYLHTWGEAGILKSGEMLGRAIVESLWWWLVMQTTTKEMCTGCLV